MKTLQTWIDCGLILVVGLVLWGCKQEEVIKERPARPFSPASKAVDPLAVALVPHEGTGRIDHEIRESQARIHTQSNSVAVIEHLGWLYVTKARESYDAGFYKLAEQCALAIAARDPESVDALLLRGHVLHSEHHFKEAQALARELVARRGLAFDYGLLGDILVDIGQLDEAARAYQSMLDLKPDPQGYARAAHIRWLTGDLNGAIELMRMAARGASPRDPESAAWWHTQLARHLWQSGSKDEASRVLDIALDYQKDYAPALLLRGRMLLAGGRSGDAIQALREAASVNPLPEYLWVLSEALRTGGHEAEAAEIEGQLARTGAGADPRTYSLYLSSCGKDTETALTLAQNELSERADILTHDATAWALAAGGRNDEAQKQLSEALSHGTQDARLFFHATVINAKAGNFDVARRWQEKVEPLTPLLLPSEELQLDETAKLLRAQITGDSTGSASKNFRL